MTEKTENQSIEPTGKSLFAQPRFLAAGAVLIVALGGVSLLGGEMQPAAQKTPNPPPLSASESLAATPQTSNLQPAGQPAVVCKRFTDLSEALGAIDIACVLDLSDKGLESVPAGVAKLTKLNDLSLAKNKLTAFPSIILGMETLISLDLSGNQISQIPDGIANLKNLQSLKLTGNNLSEAEKDKVKKLFPSLSIGF